MCKRRPFYYKHLLDFVKYEIIYEIPYDVPATHNPYEKNIIAEIECIYRSRRR